jgi:hypothetical protein
MTNLRAIDGGKRAKAMAEASILQCPCGSREVIETRTGVVLGKDGKVIHRGTLGRICAHCKKEIS